MRYLLAGIMLGSMAMAPFSFAGAKFDQTANAKPGAEAASADLLAMPPGRATVIGGVIRDVDPVRDQLTLKIFGGHSMKILFDERTQVYRDGVKSTLSGLRPAEHASIETMLDGTTIFARSIHMLSQAPDGECQGQVIAYNSETREMTLSESLSREPIKLRIPASVAIAPAGQAASPSATLGSSDLVKGALISAKFESGNDGEGVATEISILATPGSSFVFSGNVTFLDMHTQRLVIVDPRDGRSYSLSFDPSHLPESRNLHQGSHVTVTANFDGSRYVATAMTID